MNETVETEVSSQETQHEVQQETTERPEWLPEKFSDPAELGKAYKSLESKLGEKEEDIRARLSEELNQERYGNRPQSAGDYELPEIIDEETGFNNELLQWWADHAYENGFSQDQFKEGIEKFAEFTQPQEIDLEGEAAKLGENAEARIDSVSMFARQFFPEDVMPAIERLCQGHDGIIALEAIMNAVKDPSMTADTNVASTTTESDLQEMMRDERYWNPARRDANFVRQVDEGFKKLYG
jgi:hypothetical protein